MNFDINGHLTPPVQQGSGANSSITQLPVAAMSRLAAVAGDLLAKKPPPANLFACAGALIFSHLPDQVMVFDWSPLRRTSESPEPGQQPQSNCDGHIIVPIEQAQHDLTAWLIPTVARVVPEVLRRTRDLFKFGRVVSPCFLAIQGST